MRKDTGCENRREWALRSRAAKRIGMEGYPDYDPSIDWRRESLMVSLSRFASKQNERAISQSNNQAHCLS